MKMRKSGILLHISSLPNAYGIGSYGKEAYDFVDFLKSSKQSYWQILPLGPTSYGDSPYQSFSAFANNPYFIDLDMLVNEGLLEYKDIENLKTDNNIVDYAKIYETRFDVLRKAYYNFNLEDESFKHFISEKEWLHDYAMFMTIKFLHQGISWDLWPDNYRLRDAYTLEQLNKNHYVEIMFWKFIQFKAFQQWYNLKKYANERKIEIIGDMPIYVAFDSSDAWANPSYFQFDDDRKPVLVAGVPPDNFSQDGQLWGNPLYNWNYMKTNNYDWWVKRVKAANTDFDIVRIDHFIGFVNYYAIPFQDSNAKNGQWLKGPGIDLFNKIKDVLGEVRIIAEDLGVVTDEVREVINLTGFSNMKVMQFAFNPSGQSEHLPYEHSINNVVYTGTHDNPTSKSWFEQLDNESKKFCMMYLNIKTEEDFIDAFLKVAHSSIANTCIVPIQDYLNLGDEGRMNQPSILGGNWSYRLKKEDLNEGLANKILEISKTYGRNI